MNNIERRLNEVISTYDASFSKYLIKAEIDNLKARVNRLCVVCVLLGVATAVQGIVLIWK